MGFSVWTVPGEACGEHAQQGGELCGGQASGTVRRQRFLPVRVWLVVGFGILSPSYVDKRLGGVVLYVSGGCFYPNE